MSARADLCGGRSVTIVPTATSSNLGQGRLTSVAQRWTDWPSADPAGVMSRIFLPRSFRCAGGVPVLGKGNRPHMLVIQWRPTCG
jgi:hypothetical protein